MTDYAIDRLVASVKHATVNIIKYLVWVCIMFYFALIFFFETGKNWSDLERL